MSHHQIVIDLDLEDRGSKDAVLGDIICLVDQELRENFCEEGSGLAGFEEVGPLVKRYTVRRVDDPEGLPPA